MESNAKEKATNKSIATTFLPSCGHVKTTIRMHHMDADETYRGKTRRWLHKDAMSYIFNKSWKEHPTKQQLYGHLPPIAKTIHKRQTQHAGHCWRTKDEIIHGVLLLAPSHGRANIRWPIRAYLQQLCVVSECRLEDRLGAEDNKEKIERERVRKLRVFIAIRWYWWWCMWCWNPQIMSNSSLSLSLSLSLHLSLSLSLSWFSSIILSKYMK